MKIFLRIVLGILSWQAVLGWLWPLFLMAIYAAHKPRFVEGCLAVDWRPWVTTPREFLHRINWPAGMYTRSELSGKWIRVAHKSVATARPWTGLSLTIGWGFVLNPRAGRRVLRHELVHTRQHSDYALAANIYSSAAAAVHQDPWIYLGLALTWPLLILPNFINAVLRGGRFNLDSEHERSARAQTDIIGGESWEQVEARRIR